MTNRTPPTPRQRAGIAIGSAVALLMAIVGGSNLAVQTVDRPYAVATAIMAPDARCLTDAPPAGVDCRAPDMNLEFWDGGKRRVVKPPHFNKTGHAEGPKWEAGIPKVPRFLYEPTSPDLGWPVDNYMTAVARKQRGLRFCTRDVEAYDQAHGTALTTVAEAAVRDFFERPLDEPMGARFDVLPAEKRCDQYDLEFGMNAEAPTGEGGCGGNDAWGCANLRSGGWGYYVRTTINGGRYAGGEYDDGTAYWIWEHEGPGHGTGNGHTGAYAGLPAHSHTSYMGMLCWAAAHSYRPCDNPRGLHSALDLATNETPPYAFKWGLKLVSANATPTPNPTPSPTPSPSPSPTPPPQPSPTVQAGNCVVRIWDAVARHWVILVQPINACTDTAYAERVQLDAAGNVTRQFGFAKLAGPSAQTSEAEPNATPIATATPPGGP
jgi:hypothetical protein